MSTSAELADKAKAAFGDKKYEVALDLYLQAVVAFESEAPALEATRAQQTQRSLYFSNAAMCQLSLNRPKDAHASCCKALAADASNEKALYRRAMASKELAHYLDAVMDLEKLCDLPGCTAASKKAAQTQLPEVRALFDQQKRTLKSARAGESKAEPPKPAQVDLIKNKPLHQPKAAGAQGPLTGSCAVCGQEGKISRCSKCKTIAYCR